MPVQFISHHYSNKLGNPGEKQVSMKRFFILRFTPGNTEAVLEMVDGFLNIYPDWYYVKFWYKLNREILPM